MNRPRYEGSKEQEADGRVALHGGPACGHLRFLCPLRSPSLEAAHPDARVDILQPIDYPRAMADNASIVRASGTATIGSLILHAGVSTFSATLMAMSGNYATNLNHPMQVVSMGSGSLAALLFLVWISSAHGHARRVSSEVRFGRFWTVAGFFVPLVNLIHPYQVMSDVWRVFTRSDVRPVRVWWFGMLGMLIVFFTASKLIDPVDRIYLQVSAGIVSAALCLATAYVVWRIVRSAAHLTENEHVTSEDRLSR